MAVVRIKPGRLREAAGDLGSGMRVAWTLSGARAVACSLGTMVATAL